MPQVRHLRTSGELNNKSSRQKMERMGSRADGRWLMEEIRGHSNGEKTKKTRSGCGNS